MDIFYQFLIIATLHVWSPPTAKSLERIHSYFACSLPCIDGFVKLTLAERRRYHTAVQVFKSIRKLSPVYLHDQFSNTYDLTGHFDKNQFRVFIPRVRTSFGKSSFYY